MLPGTGSAYDYIAGDGVCIRTVYVIYGDYLRISE